MGNLDLRKELKQVYQSSANSVAEVEVPSFTFARLHAFIGHGRRMVRQPAG